MSKAKKITPKVPLNPESSAGDTIQRRSDGIPGRRTVSQHERQLQAILDHSPNLVFVKDPSGRSLFVNRRFEDVFHRTREEVINKTDDDPVCADAGGRLSNQ